MYNYQICFRKFKTKNLGLAHGLSLAGNTLGGLLVPVVFAYLVDSWGYSGSLLISAAILLHTVPASLLLRFEDLFIHCYRRCGGSSGDVVAHWLEMWWLTD